MRTGFSFLAAPALLICLIVGICWQRSFRRCDVLIGGRAGSRLLCTSEFGLLVFEYESKQQCTIRPGWSYFVSPLPRRFRRHDEVAGFALYKGSIRHYLLLPPTPFRGLTIPYWLVFAISAVLPAGGLVRRLRRRLMRSRLRGGLCPRCGYDLRGTPGSCPECGAVIDANLPETAASRTV